MRTGSPHQTSELTGTRQTLGRCAWSVPGRHAKFVEGCGLRRAVTYHCAWIASRSCRTASQSKHASSRRQSLTSHFLHADVGVPGSGCSASVFAVNAVPPTPDSLEQLPLAARCSSASSIRDERRRASVPSRLGRASLVTGAENAWYPAQERCLLDCNSRGSMLEHIA